MREAIDWEKTTMFDPEATFERIRRVLELDPEEADIQRRWLGAREPVVWRAVAAAGHSTSYRPFPVGCAVWGFDPSPYLHAPERHRIYKGANIKATASTPKVCAEMPAVMGAMQDRITRVVGMVVFGNPREEDGEPVLYPCEVCRVNLRKIPIIRPDTHVILARPKDADSFSHIVETTMEEIWEKFQTPQAE
jgi:cytidine deaminase